jgi:outer membrane protein OmpA-like peptidoglycan-associated protein
MLLSVVTFLIATSAIAQKTTKTPKPKVSAGLLGAVNYTQFRLVDKPTADYKYDFGYALGAYLNIPLSKTISFEPQGQFSVLKYTIASQSGTPAQFEGTLQYQSYPLLFKFQTGKKFALLAGPQLDYTNTLKNKSGLNFYKRDFEDFGVNLNLGFELFPTSVVQVYGKYIHGFSNMRAPQRQIVGGGYYNQGFQFGVKVRLFKGKDTPPPPPPPAPVVAPVVVAPAPPADTDGDGIPDAQDKCPNQKGLAKYGGCPIPDTDKDGVNDEMDKCPNVPGLAKYSGCPIPDTDGDGVNDEMDKCINEVGVASNAGCPDMAPVLAQAAQSFYFIIGKTKVVDAKSAQSLADPVVELLNKYPKLRLAVEGHADITGSDKINDVLSQKRAEAVVKWFADKGIPADRFTAKGFGSKNPTGDNKTRKGRAENRRVTLVPSFVD